MNKYTNESFNVRVLKSYYFVVAAILLSIFFMCSNMAEDIFPQKINVLKAMFTYKKTELQAMGESASAYYIIMGMRNMQWFPVLFPVLVSIPVISVLSREWNSNFFFQSIVRSSCRSYSGKIIVSAIVSSAMVTVLGVGIFSLVCYMKFPALSQLAGHFTVDIAYGDSTVKRLSVFLMMLLNLVLQGVISSLIAVLIFVILNDQFYTLSILAFAEYLSMKCLNFYLLKVVAEYGFGAQGIVMTPILLCPCTHINMDVLFEKSIGVSYWYYFTGILVLVAFICVLIQKGVRKKVSL